MIRIEQKNDQKLFIPKNVEGEPELLKIHSELTQKTISFDVSDLGSSSRYYNFAIDAITLPVGEYNYAVISDEGVELAVGLLTVGDPENYVSIIQYGDGEVNYIQYYVNEKTYINLEADQHISETDSVINYEVHSNANWIFQIYIRHHTQTDWSLIAEEEHSEQTFTGSFTVGENVEDYPKHFKIVVTTKNGKAQAESEVLQDPHYYFTVDVFSSSSALPASATELSYGIQYSEYNSIHTGTFYIYRNDELIKEQPFGVYHYSFSTYTEIPANTSSEPVIYRITGTLDNEQTDTFEVTQAAAEPEPTDYSKMRFSIEMLEDGDILWDGRGSEYYDIIRDGVRDEGYQLYHSIDGLLAGDIVEFYLMADNTNPITTHITSTARHNVYGNIMSLLYVDFEDKVAIPSDNCFEGLFWNDRGLTNAENMILPATALTENCYRTMFIDCTSLTTAPELPATTLADGCYFWMFLRCTSLTTAPSLPATTLANWCYRGMLDGCTSLTQAPALPATTLTEFCYCEMFSGCTSLTTAPELPATTLAESCYAAMLEGCTSLTQAPALPATTLAIWCYSRMLDGCTSLTNAPTLPATTLVQGCYNELFINCTNLNYIKCLATDISADRCTKNWVSSVAKVGTFVKPFEMKDWTYGNDGIPSTWFVETE